MMTDRETYALAGVAVALVAAGLLVRWYSKRHLTGSELQRLAFHKWRVAGLDDGGS